MSSLDMVLTVATSDAAAAAADAPVPAPWSCFLSLGARGRLLSHALDVAAWLGSWLRRFAKRARGPRNGTFSLVLLLLLLLVLTSPSPSISVSTDERTTSWIR
ncbi:LOW QUALITY PROTEIN: hypothetical protein O9K51_01866 [Purpureocillium lavendulum]|uniref:Uncharacterized protein n=1 Tax=Purpureocillium lavendulum TaxID=1247861 RepID=A0AB34G859_9HYPO|nr:LOW QUALITY PROTEIN: hypothetical protein O9K51_01866 [Purpureocillium lavendulum]